jgi:hypothetical protein
MARRRWGRLFENGDDDPQNHGALEGGADALEEAERHQSDVRTRQSTKERRHGEYSQPRDEHLLAAEQVPQPAGHQQERAQRDQIGIGHPGQ